MRRGVLLGALGVQPAVDDDLYLSALLQARVVVVHLLNEPLVVADDVDVADGNLHLVEHDALEVELAYLPLQRLLAPDKILVDAVGDARQRHLGRLEFHFTAESRVKTVEEETGVVVRLQHDAFAQHFVV